MDLLKKIVIIFFDYCNIYSKELELGKENTDKRAASFFISASKLCMDSFKLNSLIKETHFFILLLGCQKIQVMCHQRSLFCNWR